MSTKRWTRHARQQRSEHARAQRAARAAHAARRRTALARATGYTTLAAAVLTYGAWFGHARGSTGAGLAAAAILCAVTALVRASTHLLAPRVGRATAVAGSALLGALICIAWATIPSRCPGSPTPGRCDLAAVADFTLLGLLAPVLLALLVAIPTGTGRIMWRLTRAAHSRLRAATSGRR